MGSIVPLRHAAYRSCRPRRLDALAPVALLFALTFALTTTPSHAQDSGPTYNADPSAVPWSEADPGSGESIDPALLEGLSEEERQAVIEAFGADQDPNADPNARTDPTPSDAEGAALPTGDSKSAVTPQAISLPKAEGSIEGMGESFTPSLSSGTGTFGVPIALPAGRAGVQPSLSLSYATSGGNSSVGIGWGLGVPFIARQTDRGMARYLDGPAWHREEDRFIYNGGQELVPVDSAQMALVDASGRGYNAAPIPSDVTGWQQYRARVEGGFMRFFRSPDGTRWVVQGKDGTRFDFGMLPLGEGPRDLDTTTAVQSESDGGAGRIATWHLTRMSDAHGSTVYYRYEADGGARYLTDVYYLSPASCATTGSTPMDRMRCNADLYQYGAHVRLAYEQRGDVTSGYTTGWRVETALRLTRITVAMAEEAIGERFLVRRYHLRYDPSSYHSLLSEVQLEGRTDIVDGALGIAVSRDTQRVPESAVGPVAVGRTLPPMRFSYTTMPESGPQAPGFGGLDTTVRVAAGSPDVSVDAGRVDLFDVNSDGLPDVLVTDPARYRTANGKPAVGVFFNGFTGPNARPAGAAATFSAAVPVPMPENLSGILNLSNANIVPMDVDGEGRSDFLHMPRLDRYGYFTPTRAADGPRSEVSPAKQGWRFSYAQVELERGTDPRVDFVRDPTHYKTLDVNGDHLIDIVRTTGTVMQTWLNLGWVPGGEGKFGQATWTGSGWQISHDPIESCLLFDGLPVDFADPEIRLADMNGDGIQDIVRVRRGYLAYWPGRGPGLWGDGPSSCGQWQGEGRERVVSNPPAELNVELDGVFLQDMNGDGASDVVQVRYREMDVWFSGSGESFTNRITVPTPFNPAYAQRVRFADLDGSGTDDLIFGHAGGWEYLDPMGGLRPRLLTRVESPLGGETELEYGSSADDYLADLVDAASCLDPVRCDRFTWSRIEPTGCEARFAQSGEPVGPVGNTNLYAAQNARCYRSGGSPVVSTVVRGQRSTDHFGAINPAIGDNLQYTAYAYHDGYYEGIEQEFRGFGAGEAIAYGDGSHPTEIARSFFHQGRRPNEIATDRIADNPNEALKGRMWKSEVFDEGGVYLSTGWSDIVLRQLAVGLDGRAITYGYVQGSHTLAYDTSRTGDFSAPSELQRAEVIYEALSAGGLLGAPVERIGRVIARSPSYVETLSTTDSVDNLGHVLQETAHGRVYDSRTPSAIFDEAIVSHAEPLVINDSGQWIWRTGRTYLTGHGTTELLGDSTQTYNEVGDVVYGYQLAQASQTFAFGSDETAAASPAASFVQANQVIEVSSAYDAWGNATASCAGADLRAGAAACLRYGEVRYDAAYAQVPQAELTAVHRDLSASYCAASSAPFCMVQTLATWERGLGALTWAFEPNGSSTTMTYDGLGRLTSILGPDNARCPGDAGAQRLFYDVRVGGAPVSEMRSITPLDCQGESAPEMESRTYIDGLGRPRASLAYNGIGTASWQQSGVQLFSARGTPTVGYQNAWIENTDDPSPAQAVALPNVPSTQAYYDAFGRTTATVLEDGARTATVYRPFETWAYDPLDLQEATPPVGSDPTRINIAHGTPTITRQDGHGRTIEVVLHQRQLDGREEFHHLLTSYRADGAVLHLARARSDSRAPMDPNATLPAESTERYYFYDTVGRRLSATDPDTDSRSGTRTAQNRSWRYLFSRVGDLVAVRDPRGCGQNFYYDHAGRLLGEDYVQCAEAQAPADLPDEVVPAGAIAMEPIGAAQPVDVRYFYDEAPSWPGSWNAPSAANQIGRLAAVSDRAQRSIVAYTARGEVQWTGRQVAMLGEAAPIGDVLRGYPIDLDVDDAPLSQPRSFDITNTYVVTEQYYADGSPYARQYPADPDWATMGGTGAAPLVQGSIVLDARGLPHVASAFIDAKRFDVLNGAEYEANGLPVYQYFGQNDGSTPVRPPAAYRTFLYDRRLRPRSASAAHLPGVPNTADRQLSNVGMIFDQRYDWDAADNLIEVRDESPSEEWPAGQKPRRQVIEHDALYRVANVAFSYRQDGGAWGLSDQGVDWRTERARRKAVDPMASEAPPSVSKIPTERVVDLTYEFDWLGNMVEWTDDAGAFHERSLGQNLGNGNLDPADGTRRPSALYLASNLPTSTHAVNTTIDRGGWVELHYGESGNVDQVTVRGQCVDASKRRACYDPATLGFDARAQQMASNCACAVEHHYQYRWDELSRLAEARRYDRGGKDPWTLAVRQRYLYDSGNQRIVKQTLDVTSTTAPERTALYVYPGEFERRGVRHDATGESWVGDAALGTETQYSVAGARLVWKPGDPKAGTDREHRLSIPITNLISTVSAVVDGVSGDLLERTTFYPNGARETWRGTEKEMVPADPLGFTGKEGDEEVGLVYFGERYLMPHLARWASPDPLHTHANGGGEFGNSYHYISGNLLQARDPLGLEDGQPDPEAEATSSQPDRGCGANSSCPSSTKRKAENGASPQPSNEGIADKLAKAASDVAEDLLAAAVLQAGDELARLGPTDKRQAAAGVRFRYLLRTPDTRIGKAEVTVEVRGRITREENGNVTFSGRVSIGGRIKGAPLPQAGFSTPVYSLRFGVEAAITVSPKNVTARLVGTGGITAALRQERQVGSGSALVLARAEVGVAVSGHIGAEIEVDRAQTQRPEIQLTLGASVSTFQRAASEGRLGRFRARGEVAESQTITDTGDDHAASAGAGSD